MIKEIYLIRILFRDELYFELTEDKAIKTARKLAREIKKDYIENCKIDYSELPYQIEVNGDYNSEYIEIRKLDETTIKEIKFHKQTKGP